MNKKGHLHCKKKDKIKEFPILENNIIIKNHNLQKNNPKKDCHKQVHSKMIQE